MSDTIMRSIHFASNIVKFSAKHVSIDASRSNFSREQKSKTHMLTGIFRDIRYKHIRKERFLFSKNLSHIMLSKTIFLCNHRKLTDMKTLSKSRICHNTSRTTSNIVVLTFSTNILETIWITDREGMSSLSPTSPKNLLPINRRSPSKKPVYSKSLSFLEFTNHREVILKIVGGLYEKRNICQTVFYF